MRSISNYDTGGKRSHHYGGECPMSKNNQNKNQPAQNIPNLNLKDLLGQIQKKNPNGFGNLSPLQITVIAALLANALTVESILVDKDQRIEIVLEGSVKKKTRLDKLLNELNNYSLGDILDSFLK
jgi:hypothetical protein